MRGKGSKDSKDTKDKYTVFGNPVEHSKSPLIHSRFAEQTGQAIEYTKTCVEDNNIVRALEQFASEGGHGANITVPFKEDAFRFCSQLTERASQAGAVNTVTITADGLYKGDNTDGTGLVRDVTTNLGWLVRGQRVLVVGAGGAVRGVLGPLLDEGPGELVIANRTHGKAVELAELFASNGRVSALPFDRLEGRFDLVINGTSASLGGELPPLSPSVLSPETRVYDMMYSDTETIFNRWCRGKGVLHTSDGLGMLVEQAAESFYSWRQVRPDTTVVIHELKQS